MVGSDDSFPFGTIFRGLLLVVGRVVIQRQSTYKSGTNVTSTFFAKIHTQKTDTTTVLCCPIIEKVAHLANGQLLNFWGLPSWELTYPLPRHVGRCFSFSFLVGYVRSLQGTYLIRKKPSFAWLSQLSLGHPCREVSTLVGNLEADVVRQLAPRYKGWLYLNPADARWDNCHGYNPEMPLIVGLIKGQLVVNNPLIRSYFLGGGHWGGIGGTLRFPWNWGRV